MPGNSGTVSLPRRGQDALNRLQGRPGVGHPVNLPGGIGGPAPLPSRLTASQPPPQPATIPGGNNGRVALFTPAVDFDAPFYLGSNRGFSIRSVDGTPIVWLRAFFANVAGVRSFQAQESTTPNWTSNAVSSPGPVASDIPISHKHFSFGGYFREAYVNEQLFDQLTDRHHPWPILNPGWLRRRQARGQPIEMNPYFFALTRYQPSTSYGQTTPVLLSAALANILPATNATDPSNPPTLTGSPYGAY